MRRTEDETTSGRRHGSSHRRLAAPPSFLPSYHACSFPGHARATEQQPEYINTLLAFFSRPQSFLSHRSISLTTLIIQIHRLSLASTHPNIPTVKMLYSAILAAAALVSSAVAIQVTAPTNTTGWKTDGSEEIQWDVSPPLQHTPIGTRTRADPGSPSRPTPPKSPSSSTHPLAPTHPSRSLATTPPRSDHTSTPPPAA